MNEHDAIGRLAWVMAWVGLVVGQFHAMARHNTADGKEDLQLWTTRVWSDPRARLLQAAARLGEPGRRLPDLREDLAPGVRGVHAVRLRRTSSPAARSASRSGPGGSRSPATCWACVGVFCDYWTQWDTYNAFFDVAFLITLPGFLLTLLGSTLLGIVLLRREFVPRSSAWLLALTFPLAFGILQVTSMGSAALPVMFAFGIAGRQLARASEPADATPSVTRPVHSG